MYGSKSTYTKNQRPHGNTTLGLEGKPTNRINKAAVRPSIEPRSNTAWQHHLNNTGGGGWRRRREGRSWSGVTFWSHFFTFVALLIYACSLCFTFCSHFLHFFHSCVFVVFSRFWLKTTNFPDSAALLGKHKGKK